MVVSFSMRVGRGLRDYKGEKRGLVRYFRVKKTLNQDVNDAAAATEIMKRYEQMLEHALQLVQLELQLQCTDALGDKITKGQATQGTQTNAVGPSNSATDAMSETDGED